MIDNIVLFLMQLKGMSRKTIYRYFHLSSGEYSLQDIQMMIKEASLDATKITVPNMAALQDAFDKYNSIMEQSAKLNIRITSYLDKNFPDKLRKISDPPAILYTLGNMECMNEKAIAVIGTREPTEYGAKIADNLGYVLGRDGYTVVSGLAYGCDKFGHMGCLRAGGKTVAVMAGGLDKVYPAIHRELAEEIVASGGCLVSEYPVKSKTYQNFFVERDRLQSGLSEGIIVVETGVKGGTWHTVQYAKDYNREVGCYKHPAKYLKEDKTQGNLKLLQSDETFSIGNNDDLYKFRELIDKKHSDLMQMEPDNVVTMTQPSFLGVIGG